jgi:hypothetical protein
MKRANPIARQTINNVNLPVEMISMMASLINTPANSIVYFVDPNRLRKSWANTMFRSGPPYLWQVSYLNASSQIYQHEHTSWVLSNILDELFFL